MGNHFPFHLGPPLDPVFVAAMKHRDGRIASPAAGEADRGLRVQRERSTGPTVREREVMATHGVQFDGRVYRYAGFSYDRLVDAMNQARRMGDPT
jgi:hypothetical protein